MKDTGNEEKRNHTRNRKIKSEGFKHDELLSNGKTKTVKQSIPYSFLLMSHALFEICVPAVPICVTNAMCHHSSGCHLLKH